MDPQQPIASPSVMPVAKNSKRFIIPLAVAVFLVIVGLIAVVVIARTPAQPPAVTTILPTSRPTPTVGPTVQPTLAPTIAADAESPNGQDMISTDDTSKDGPWNADLQIATSTDGDTFSDSKVLVERAGVPSVTRDAQGGLIVAFQWFPTNNPVAFAKVAIIKSSDGGTTWSQPKQAVFKDYPKSYSRAFDPTVVKTLEGNIRMYFTVNRTTRNDHTEIPTSYFSAISTDGINYEFEPGERYGVAGTKILDPAVVVYRGDYHMTAPKSPSPGAYHATSHDGITYVQQADITSLNGFLWTGNLAVHPKGLRFYGGSVGGKLFYAESEDGTTWGAPVTIELEGGDPAMIQVASNKYLLIYAGPPRNKKNTPPPL